MKKSNKRMIQIVGLGFSLLFIFILLFPIAKLAFTNVNITQSMFADQYYVKINSDSYDFKVFIDYMKSKGWQEVESKRMGGLYVFERNGKTKEITNTNIKTIFIDDKLNLSLKKQ